MSLQPPEHFERFLSRQEAAEYLTARGLRIAMQTLARKQSDGTGPVCIKCGRWALYRKNDLDVWFVAQLSEPGVARRIERRTRRDPGAFNRACD